MADLPLKIILPSGYKIAYRQRERAGMDAPAMLMIHGLGDDSTAWEHWTEDYDVFPEWNLYAVDLPGFGSSPGLTSGMSLFPKMVELLTGFMSVKKIKRVAVIAHSMGGVVGSLLIHSLHVGRGGAVPELRGNTHNIVPPELASPVLDGPELIGYINIEGNLTNADTFVSSKAVAANEDSRFARWMAGFIEAMIRSEHASERRYASALLGCEKRSFIAAAQALLTWSDLPDGEDSWCGALYRWLPFPKVFIGGQDSLPQATRDWLDASGMIYEIIDPAGHAVMNDQPEKTARIIEDNLVKWMKD